MKSQVWSHVECVRDPETAAEFLARSGVVGGEVRVCGGALTGFWLRISDAVFFDWSGVECVNLRGVSYGKIQDNGKRVRRSFSVSLPSGTPFLFLFLSAFEPLQRLQDPEPLISAVLLHGLRFRSAFSEVARG